jgi:hypothetical protein
MDMFRPAEKRRMTKEKMDSPVSMGRNKRGMAYNLPLMVIMTQLHTAEPM